MKIDSKLLYGFMKKVTLDGAVPSFILKMNNEGIRCQVKNTDVACNIGALQIPSEDMTLPIKNSKFFLSMLKSFDGEVEIKKNNNLVSIFDKTKQVDIILSSEEFIDNNMTEQPPFIAKLEGGVNINAQIFKKIAADMTSLQSKAIIIEFKDKKMNLMSGEKGFDTVTHTIPADYVDCRSKFGEFLLDIISVMGDNITIAMKDSWPVMITEKVADGKGYVKYAVAPLMEE